MRQTGSKRPRNANGKPYRPWYRPYFNSVLYQDENLTPSESDFDTGNNVFIFRLSFLDMIEGDNR